MLAGLLDAFVHLDRERIGSAGRRGRRRWGGRRGLFEEVEELGLAGVVEVDAGFLDLDDRGAVDLATHREWPDGLDFGVANDGDRPLDAVGRRRIHDGQQREGKRGLDRFHRAGVRRPRHRDVARR